MSALEALLERDGVLVYKTRGGSMRPLLRQNRDLVTIRVPASRLQKYDVALYRQGEQHVLHRVIAVRDGHYLIRGDNSYRLETVPEGAVIGVMTDFCRDGKSHAVTEPGYRRYVRLWDALYPLRCACHHLRRGLRRLLRRPDGHG